METLNKIVNLSILRNPINWVTIFVIVLFAAYAAFVVNTARTKGLFNGSTSN